jgi:phage head maturation protease
MSQRIRLAIADRGEEVRDDAAEDFPGRDELRQRILAAHSTGDRALLGSLQAQHRDMRLAYTAPSVRMAVRTPGRPDGRDGSGSVLRTSTRVEASEGGDPSKQLSGYLLTWGEQPTAIGENGDEAVFLDVQPRSITSWLSRVNPTLVGLIADHETDSCGCWHSFAIDDKGLFGVAQADDSPAATLLLDCCDDGRAAGLSFAARIVRSRPTGRTVRGLPVIVADEISLSEAGPSPDPSDPNAEIVSVRGRAPAYTRAQGDQRPVRGQSAPRPVGWPGRRGWRWSS